jgi:BirA family biotin operon repressor/biotin-[acetyl-CoA-carboxylase] ligase
VTRVEIHLPIEFLGVRAERHESLPSTNDQAFRRASEGAPEGLIVVTRHQSEGRGRHGRTWWDRPGDSVLASLLLRPELPLDRYPQLGMAMACAVAEAAERLVPGERFDVKWPNDVLHEGRKLCGILAETRVGAGAGGGGTGPGAASPAARPPLVIGFGVNVNQTAEDLPEEIARTATSLRLAAGGRALDPDGVLREIVARFEPYHARSRAGDLSGLWGAVKSRLPRPGTPVVVTSGAHRVEGFVEGYTDSGAISVRDAEGVVLTLAAGEIVG